LVIFSLKNGFSFENHFYIHATKKSAELLADWMEHWKRLFEIVDEYGNGDTEQKFIVHALAHKQEIAPYINWCSLKHSTTILIWLCEQFYDPGTLVSFVISEFSNILVNLAPERIAFSNGGKTALYTSIVKGNAKCAFALMRHYDIRLPNIFNLHNELQHELYDQLCGLASHDNLRQLLALGEGICNRGLICLRNNFYGDLSNIQKQLHSVYGYPHSKEDAALVQSFLIILNAQLYAIK